MHQSTMNITSIEESCVSYYMLYIDVWSIYFFYFDACLSMSEGALVNFV